MPQIGERLAGLFEPAAAPERSGLYLASGNAGFQSSLLFWAEAQRSGVAVANPELFPWTLANAPCGWLTRHFQVTGPNLTYTGRAEAAMAALGQACAHLRAGLVDSAWVLAVDFAQAAGRRTILTALRLGREPAGIVLDLIETTPRSGKSARSAFLQ